MRCSKEIERTILCDFGYLRKPISDIGFCVRLLWVLFFKLVTFVLWLLSFMFCVLVFVCSVMYCEYRVLRVKQRLKGSTMETKKGQDKSRDVSIRILFYFLAFLLACLFHTIVRTCFPYMNIKGFSEVNWYIHLKRKSTRQPLFSYSRKGSRSFLIQVISYYFDHCKTHCLVISYPNATISHLGHFVPTLVISTKLFWLQNDIYTSVCTQVISYLLLSFSA